MSEVSKNFDIPPRRRIRRAAEIAAIGAGLVGWFVLGPDISPRAIIDAGRASLNLSTPSAHPTSPFLAEYIQVQLGQDMCAADISHAADELQPSRSNHGARQVPPDC